MSFNSKFLTLKLSTLFVGVALCAILSFVHISLNKKEPLPREVVDVLEVLSRIPDGAKLDPMSNRFGNELKLRTICRDFENRHNKIFHYEICEGYELRVFAEKKNSGLVLFKYGVVLKSVSLYDTVQIHPRHASTQKPDWGRQWEQQMDWIDESMRNWGLRDSASRKK